MRKTLFFALCVGLLCLGTSSWAVGLSVMAGSNPHDHCPVVLKVKPSDFWFNLAEGDWKLVNVEDEEEEIPLFVIRRNLPDYAFQMSPEGTYVQTLDQFVWEIRFIVNGLEPFEKRDYRITNGKAPAENPVSLQRDEEKLEIKVAGKPFTTYKYAVNEEQPRPIFYPVFGPDGARMTRGFPFDPREGEKHDHPHHQSLWVSHGDVNGVNFWHLGDEQGYQHLKEFSVIEDSPVCGVFEAVNDWTDEEGNKVLEERRHVTVWGTSDEARMIDFDLTFAATEGEVTFGDTKEGGLLSLRVAGTMKEESGGKITNVHGQSGGEAWGKAARWCDYSGEVEDKKVGMTIMDNPSNIFYPTRYHVRTYGLFTANPFGLSHFIDNSVDGSYTLSMGETLRLQYRLYIHEGDVEEGNVVEAYANYADGPTVEFSAE